MHLQRRPDSKVLIIINFFKVQSIVFVLQYPVDLKIVFVAHSMLLICFTLTLKYRKHNTVVFLMKGICCEVLLLGFCGERRKKLTCISNSVYTLAKMNAAVSSF